MMHLVCLNTYLHDVTMGPLARLVQNTPVVARDYFRSLVRFLVWGLFGNDLWSSALGSHSVEVRVVENHHCRPSEKSFAVTQAMAGKCHVLVSYFHSDAV